ncbi:TPA: hypothetical protein VIN20_001172 [Streptococcus pyogenes]|nr:hypothetical protein [Streptococcus pyogenes]
MTMLGYRLSAEVLGSAILPLLAGYLIRQAIAQVYSDLKIASWLFGLASSVAYGGLVKAKRAHSTTR